MSLPGLRMLIASLLCLALVAPIPALASAAQAAAPDAASDAPGFLILQIDGLSEPVLRRALEDGAMPFVGGLIDDGSHALGSWRTTAATTTTVTQAGLLHGRWRGIPGFRWWDRESGRLIDFLDREAAREFGERLSGPLDLLADGGASITNLYSGGAPRVVLTATHLDGPMLAWEVARYAADLSKDARVIVGLGDGVATDALRAIRRTTAPFTPGYVKRKAPVPIIGPALEWALVDVTAAGVAREVQRGTPLVYATFTTYDEVGHYAGPDHGAAIDVLGRIDTALRFLAAVAEDAPRPYHFVILSDHGQTDGLPFALRYGETLTDVVRGLMRDDADPGAHADADVALPELVVAASGNLAHVYFPRQDRRQRLDLDAVEALHPPLVAGLAAHPGVGIVVAATDDGGLVALGPDGSRDLVHGTVVGRDPVAHYGPLAATSLVNIAASPDAGDLVVISTYDPLTDEVASFEPQLGSHGGIGGPQMQPFVVYPRALEPSPEPLLLEGVEALRDRLVTWLAAPATTLAPGATPSPPPFAHVGDEVCVSAQVSGGSGEVCARRDRFGASWRLEVTDTEDDGWPVKATIGLEVVDGRRQSAELRNDLGHGRTARSSGTFTPLVGSAIGDLSIETCLDIRFRPDRCSTDSVALPQLAARATPEQRARLEELVFDMPLEDFVEVWGQAERVGVDAAFDWSSDGCSGGPFTGLVDDLAPACVRHDFGYRNYGRLFYDPTDEVRRRVDEQLGTDATTLRQERLAPGLTDSLQRFGAPVFFGTDLQALWPAPSFLVRIFGLEEDDAPG